MSTKVMTTNEYSKVAYTDWHYLVNKKYVTEAYKENIEAVKKAIAEYQQRPRKLRVLAIHGSSRSNVDDSSAHELSNSQLLLRYGLQAIRSNRNIEIEEVNLREYAITPCDNCYATTSALCGFPCDCFPFDPMQKLYPKVLRSDVLLMSTGVNQSAMSSRLKLFCDRLISLDGGYAREEYVEKNAELRKQMILQSTTKEVQYNQRLQGRVCAFFIASKDDKDTGGVDEDGRKVRSYIKMVAESLYRGFYDYGCVFADGDDWYASFGSNPFVEMAYDKSILNNDKEAQKQAQLVVRKAVEKAIKTMKTGYKQRKHPINRT